MNPLADAGCAKRSYKKKKKKKIYARIQSATGLSKKNVAERAFMQIPLRHQFV